MSREIFIRQLAGMLQERGNFPADKAMTTAVLSIQAVEAALDALDHYIDTITCDRVSFDVEGIACGILVGKLNDRQKDMAAFGQQNGMTINVETVSLVPDAVQPHG